MKKMMLMSFRLSLLKIERFIMPARKPRTKKQKQKAIAIVMEEFKNNKLTSGKSKKKVKSKKQALAISLNIAGIKRNKKRKKRLNKK